MECRDTPLARSSIWRAEVTGCGDTPLAHGDILNNRLPNGTDWLGGIELGRLRKGPVSGLVLERGRHLPDGRGEGKGRGIQY